MAGVKFAVEVRRQVPGATLYRDAARARSSTWSRRPVPAAVHRGRAGQGAQGLLVPTKALAGAPARPVATIPAPSPSRSCDRGRLPAEPGRVPVRQLLAARGPGHAGRAGLRPGLRRPVRRNGVRGPAGLAGRFAAAAGHAGSGRRRAGRPALPGPADQPGAAAGAAALPVVPAAADGPRAPPADPDPGPAGRAPVAGGRPAPAARPRPGRHLEPAEGRGEPRRARVRPDGAAGRQRRGRGLRPQPPGRRHGPAAGGARRDVAYSHGSVAAFTVVASSGSRRCGGSGAGRP